jgi:hypothetical protein
MAFVKDTTNVIVGGGTGSGAVGSSSGATVNDTDSKVSNAINLLQNPSLAGAAALYGQDVYPFRNELDQFASYAPIFTLGALTNIELNFPLTYRTLGPAVKIIRSGGGGGPTIPSIYDLDGKREFFIEDVKIKNMVAPNPNSRHTNVTNVTFKIIEPYSMGQLFHNLRTASLVTGHKNYVDAPFLLSVAFIGYDDDGNVKSPFFSQRHFPIQIVQIDMEVSESGAVYNVQAVPYSEKATTNRTARVKTDIKCKGDTVAEILQNGAESLTVAMNRTADSQEDAFQVLNQDKYVIYFPNTTLTGALGQAASFGNAIINGVSSVPGSIGALYRSLVGSGTTPRGPEIARIYEDEAVLTTGSFIGDKIKIQALTDINEIGRSTLLRPGTLDSAGNVAFQLPSFVQSVTDPTVFERRRLSYSASANEYTFKSGTSVMDIIEEVIITSEYGRTFAQADPSFDGRVPWFRIEVQTYNVGGLLAGLIKGESPKVYVYRVVPYRIDKSTIDGPGASSMVSKVVKQLFAAKAYSYIYTGVNKDIIDFDLKFNLAFYTGVQAARSQRQLASVLGGALFMGAGEREPVHTTGNGSFTAGGADGDAPVRDEESTTTSSGNGANGGTVSDDSETSVARSFNDMVINTSNDMIQVELKIHGDPYFISDVSLGNYVGLPSVPFLPVTIDGAMNPIDGEVHIILNFRTPIDYDDKDGFVKYPLGGFLPISMFSGLYQVIQVENNFNKGKFEQTLKLVRKRNQDLSLESVASSVLSFIRGGGAVITKGIPGLSNLDPATPDNDLGL